MRTDARCWTPRLRITLLTLLWFTALVHHPLRSAFAQRPRPTRTLSAAGLDSIRTAFTSGDWNERHAALQELNASYPDALPAGVVPAIVALLTREAAAQGDHVGDEDFGEYVVDLVLTGVRTGDARVVPGILMLDGLGVSSGVAAFVASQGRAAMAALDSLAATREDRASDVAETYALMYARYGIRLTRADSAQVLRRLVQAASHPSPAVRAQVAYVAGRGPIPELLPLLAELAVTDTGQINGVYIVRRDAVGALPALRQATAALAPGALLDRLTILTGAACDGADGRMRFDCGALSIALGSAVRFAAADQVRLAVAALDVYRGIARHMLAERMITRLTAVTLDSTAGTVVARWTKR